jgi:predicted nucleic acid-binding protein
MPLYLLDANAVSDLMRGDVQIDNRVKACTDPLLTSVIARGEVLYGIARLPAGRRRQALEIKAVRVLASLRLEDVTRDTSDVFSHLKRDAKANSIPLGDNDLWIAATAVTLNAVLITRDNAFSRLSGIVVEDWTRP